MAKSNRQKYNFLAAFVSQLDQAADEKDDLVKQFTEVVMSVMGMETGEREYNDLIERLTRVETDVDSCNRGVAELELAMEELDSAGSSSDGEEPDADDDGDDDVELGRVQPPMGSVRERHRPVATAVGGAREPAVSGRGMKERIGRGR